MMKHLKQLNGIRGLFPYLKTKKPTVLLIFCLSVIDAGLSLLPIQIIAAVVDLLSTGHSVFSPILGTSLTLHLVFFGVVYASKHAVSLAYGHTNTMLSTGIIESLRDDAMTWALSATFCTVFPLSRHGEASVLRRRASMPSRIRCIP